MNLLSHAHIMYVCIWPLCVCACVYEMCVCVCVFYSYVIRLIVPNVHTNKTSYETLFEYWVWSNLWEGGEVRDRLSLKLDLREDVIDLYIFCLYLSLSVCVCVVTYCN